MKLTKYTHSCIRLEKDGQVLVLDPGNFSESAVALDGAHYLLITHAHPDHFDAPTVLPTIAQNPQLEIFAPQAVIEVIKAELPEAKASVPATESSFSLGVFDIKTFGGQHALIHPLIPTIDNIAYLVDERVYHPGDSLVVPHGLTADTALVPIHAPWSKIQEVIDFTISLRARQAFPIHNGLINDRGHAIIEGQVANFAKKYGTDYRHLEPGDSIDI